MTVDPLVLLAAAGRATRRPLQAQLADIHAAFATPAPLSEPPWWKWRWK